MKKVFLLAVVFLLGGLATPFLVPTSRAATAYYVDYANGSDSNSGKSPASPFKHCPGDKEAGSKAYWTWLSAGDSVVFKGGVVYKGTIRIRWSGKSASSPITYDGNSKGTYGSGRAIIDGELVRSQGFYCLEKIVRFITIKNFEIRNMVTDKSRPLDTAGICFGGDNEDVAVSNCFIHHVGIWTNDAKQYITGIGIKFHQPTRCKVTGCEITRAGGIGVHIIGADNCIIENNNIHDYVNWGVDISSNPLKPSTGNTVRGNVIHDLFQYDVGFWGGKPGEAPHQDFVFIRKADGIRPSGNLIERNLFYNNYKFTDFGGTAMVFVSEGDENIIRNNIFINPHSYYTIEIAWGSMNNQVYNNLLYSPRTGGIVLNSMKLPGGAKIKNNVIIAAKLILWDSSNDEKGWEVDYNYYVNTSDVPFNRIGEFKYASFPEWQNVFRNDRNGVLLKSIEQLKFLNVNGYPTRCEEMDFRLRPDSPLIDKGVPLLGFSNDFLGTSRPQGKGWEIGPYEFK